MFTIPSTSIHRCLKHQGLLGQGKDFLTSTPCLIHLYTFQSKSKFGLQVYENISKQFCDKKINELSKTITQKASPNISRVVGFSKYSHSNKLIDLSILYDIGAWYGMSLENLINSKIKSNTTFKQQDILDFITQMVQVLMNTSSETGQYLQLTPINIFVSHEAKCGYSYFPNNFGLSFDGTQWDKPYFNPEDRVFKQRSVQTSISAILFVIGMIALEMCTLQQSSVLYDNNIIDQKLLLKTLQSIKLTFSFSIFDLVSRLCSKEQDRITLKELYSEQSILFKSKKVKFEKREINDEFFSGLMNSSPFGSCLYVTVDGKYVGTLNQNFKYDGYGVLRKGNLWKGEFQNGEFKSGQYYEDNQYVLVGSIDNLGYTNGFKMALSGNKEFLYMAGLFDAKRELVRGKVVNYNGKTYEIDNTNRHSFSRLSHTSLNITQLDLQK